MICILTREYGAPAGVKQIEWRLPAKLFFDPNEIQAAHLLNKVLAPPAPRLNEVVRMIVRIGGFLARKSDGEPGAKTTWEGLRDVRTAAHIIKTLREMGLLSSCV